MARKESQASEREGCCTHTALAQNRPDCSTAASARDHIMTPYSAGTEGRKTGKVYLATCFLILFPFCGRQVLKYCGRMDSALQSRQGISRKHRNTSVGRANQVSSPATRPPRAGCSVRAGTEISGTLCSLLPLTTS